MFHIQTFSTAGTIALIIVFLVFWWWSTRYLVEQTTKRLAFFLRGARLFALLGIILLLSNLSVSWQRQVQIEPSVNIYLDASESMSHYESNVSDSLRVLLDSLRVEANIKTFSDEISQIGSPGQYSAGGNFTNINLPVEDAAEFSREFLKQPSFLISDGAHNLGALPTDDVGNAREIQLFTLFIGDSTTYPDLAIDRVDMPSIVYAGDTIAVRMRYQAENIPGEMQSNLQVNRDNEQIYSQPLQFTEGDYFVEQDIDLVLSEEGMTELSFLADSLESERDLQNNQTSVMVEVRPSRFRVLLLAAKPSMETRFLINAVQDMERFELQDHYAFSTNLIEQQDYDIIYTIGDPSILLNTDQTLDSFLESSQGAIHQVNSIGEIALIESTGSGTWIEEAVELHTSEHNPFSNFFDWNTGWETLPPVWIYTGMPSDRPILMSATSAVPVLSFRQQNVKKSIFIYGQHLWRWNFAAQNPEADGSVYTRFLEHLFFWVMQSSDRDRLRVEVSTKEDNRITAEAQVYDIAAQPVSSARIRGTIVDSTGNTYREIIFQRETVGYSATTGINKPGKYRLIAEATTGEQSFRDTTGAFEIQTISAESIEQVGDPALLRQLAESTDGIFLSQIRDAPFQDINNMGPEIVQKLSVWRARTSYWLWILISLLLIYDWFIRRRYSLL